MVSSLHRTASHSPSPPVNSFLNFHQGQMIHCTSNLCLIPCSSGGTSRRGDQGRTSIPALAWAVSQTPRGCLGLCKIRHQTPKLNSYDLSMNSKGGVSRPQLCNWHAPSKNIGNGTASGSAIPGKNVLVLQWSMNTWANVCRQVLWSSLKSSFWYSHCGQRAINYNIIVYRANQWWN